MADVPDSLKVLIDSSTHIIVRETLEEPRAVRLVRAAASPLNLAVLEWSIASGLVRCGSEVGTPVLEPRFAAPGHGGAIHCPDDAGASAIYNSREPVQALSNLEALSLEAVFILKDFHPHMDDSVVVKRIPDACHKLFANTPTIVLTPPALTPPPSTATLVG